MRPACGRKGPHLLACTGLCQNMALSRKPNRNSWRKGRTMAGWTRHFLRCQGTAVGCNAWRTFARSFCPSEGGSPDDHVWDPCNHDVAARPWGGHCLRCGLKIRERRVEGIQNSRCMAWGFYSCGVEVSEARPWAAWYTALPSTWKLDRGGHCAPNWTVPERGGIAEETGESPPDEMPEDLMGVTPAVERLRRGIADMHWSRGQALRSASAVAG